MTSDTSVATPTPTPTATPTVFDRERELASQRRELEAQIQSIDRSLADYPKTPKQRAQAELRGESLADLPDPDVEREKRSILVRELQQVKIAQKELRDELAREARRPAKQDHDRRVKRILAAMDELQDACDDLEAFEGEKTRESRYFSKPGPPWREWRHKQAQAAFAEWRRIIADQTNPTQTRR